MTRLATGTLGAPGAPGPPAAPGSPRDPLAAWPPPANVQPRSPWASDVPPWASGPVPVAYHGGKTAPDGARLAGLGARLGARVIDFFITSVISGLILAPFVSASWSRIMNLFRGYRDALSAQDATAMRAQIQVLQNDQTLARLSLIATGISLADTCLYMVGFVYWRGATPGKMATGVRVRPFDHDGKVTFGQAFMRWLGREGISAVPYIGYLYWLLDSLWPLWDQRKQALHDKMARTVVVPSR